MKRIGIHDLRQHASRYLALVARGERVEITDHRRPVAMLVPLRGDPWEHLLATGRVMPPSEAADIADEAPADYGIDATGTLATMRQLDA